MACDVLACAIRRFKESYAATRSDLQKQTLPVEDVDVDTVVAVKAAPAKRTRKCEKVAVTAAPDLMKHDDVQLAQTDTRTPKSSPSQAHVVARILLCPQTLTLTRVILLCTRAIRAAHGRHCVPLKTPRGSSEFNISMSRGGYWPVLKDTMRSLSCRAGLEYVGYMQLSELQALPDATMKRRMKYDTSAAEPQLLLTCKLARHQALTMLCFTHVLPH